MNRFLLIFVVPALLLLHMSAYGQDKWVSEKGAPLNTVALEVMPRLDNVKLRASSRSGEKDRGAYKFAEAINQQLDIVNNGSWETLDNGQMLWRQRILSPNAYSLNLGITSFYLPPSATLYLYDKDKSYIVGPLSNKDNEIHNQWWSPIIPGEEIVVEVQIDPADLELLQLEITKVNHDYKGFGIALSGSCNVDVACGGEDDETLAIIDRYRDVINSVGMYTLNGVEQCSGSLINTTRNDCTPYFLTANHCEVRGNNAAAVVVYWNFEQSFCRLPGSAASGQPGDGNRLQFNSGSSVVSNYDQSDMTLLLLDDDVDPLSNPFFAGWDVEGESFDSTLCVHHPSSEEKRISFDYQNTTPRADNFFQRVEDWDLGTTEGGSSGSPLFSKDKRIIGALTGGDAACGNDLQDDFGMLKISWEGGGTPETGLKSWLDPDNTGRTQLDGRYCVDVAKLTQGSIAYCSTSQRSASVKLFIQTGYANGADITIAQVTDGLSAELSSTTLSPGDSITIDVTVLFNFTADRGEVILSVTDEFGTTEFPIEIIVDDALPLIPTLTAPEDGARNINFDVIFDWDSPSTSHVLEISTAADFSENVRTQNVSSATSAKLKGFDSKTIYYWRVKGINQCGEGAYSEVSSFATGNIECESYESVDTPIAIGEEAVTINSFLDVEIDGLIADVNIINLRGLHTWVGDLTFTLISPAGTEVRLAVSPCDDENDFNISFDDESDNIILPCPLFDNIPYRPLDDLSAFDGESSKGRWTLQVDDDARLDGGSLDSWSLELCLNLSQSRSVNFAPSQIAICAKNPVDTFRTEGLLFGEYIGDINLSLLSSTGTPIDVIYSSTPLSGSGSLMFGMTIPDISNFIAGEQLLFITEDDEKRDTMFIDIVNQSTLESPQLVSPVAEEEGIKPRARFEWLPVANATGYRLVVANDDIFSAPVVDTVITATEYEVTEKLATNQNYFWQVIAIGECDNVTSGGQSFLTDLVDATIDRTLEAIEVYPNPTDGLLYIDGSDIDQEVRYQLINVLGSVIYDDRLNRGVKRIDLSAYNDGVYMIRLVSSNGILVRPILKAN